MVEKNVTLQIGGSNRFVRIPVSQFDTMWRFVFEIIHNNVAWEIPSGASAVLNGRKPDGNVFAFSGTIADSKVAVDCDVQMTAVAGAVLCELSILSDGKVVGTANFVLDVEAAPKAPEDVSSESTLPAYEEMFRIAGNIPADIPGYVADYLDEHKDILKPTDEQMEAAAGEWLTHHPEAYAPTDAQATAAINDWLDNHPDATTTVEDGSISFAKLSSEMKDVVDTSPNYQFTYVTTDSENVDINVNSKLGAANFVSGESYNTTTGVPYAHSGYARTNLFPVKPGSTLHTLKNQGLCLYSYKKQFVAGYGVNVAIRDTVIPNNVRYAAIFSNTTAFQYDANSYFRALTNCWVENVSLSSDDFTLPMSSVDNLNNSLATKLDVRIRYTGKSSESADIQFVYGPNILADDVYDNTTINAEGELVEGTACVLKKLFFVKPGTSINLPPKGLIIHFYDHFMNHLGLYYNINQTVTVTVPEQAFYMRMRVGQLFGTYARAAFASAKTDYLCSNAELYYPDMVVDMSADNYAQISEFLGSGTGEVSRLLTSKNIQTANRMRHAWRIASFNTYLGNKNRWTELKEFLQNYGIDIIGFQEVNTPLDPNSAGLTMEQALTSWHLSQFAIIQTEDVPSNCRPVAATSDFKVVSIEEVKYATQSNYGHRHYTKTQLKLPRWKDKKASENFMVSIYNTQLEVGTGNNNNTRLAQVAELLEAVAADTNPFIIIMGDLNEMSTGWDSVNAIKNAGFTPLFPDSSTGTANRGFYDFIFVNDRMTILDNDVVPYDLHNNISDHDLVFADVFFDYTNLISVKTSLPNCKLSGGGYWLNRRQTEPVVYTVTPDDGYTVSSISTGQGDFDLTYTNGAVVLSGNTVTIKPNLVVGDVWINVTTAKNE